MKVAVFLLVPVISFAQSWVPQHSGATASLRGVSAVSKKIAWASGTRGTWLRTVDGGATWQSAAVPGAEELDFRDVHAFSENIAYLVSIGTGNSSRIYKTIDGGAHWSLMFTNPDPQGFFDALAFWDEKNGLVVGDQVDGRIAIFTTADSGATWQRQETPPALPKEGAFAASGTCLIVRGKRDAWFATGGQGAARVFHSADGGHTWSVATTPVRNDSASAGIFSLAFSDAMHGVAVGGDYTKAEDAMRNIAITADGGRTWTAPAGAPNGFRSAVAYLADKKLWIATGPSGSDISADGGNTWQQFDKGNYNAVSFVSSEAGWAVGPRGAVARFAAR
jgi:photosystem II stability/assembly factor-like uncharacterized protein